MSYLQRTSTGLNDIAWGNLPSNVFTIPKTVIYINQDMTIAELYTEIAEYQIFDKISTIPVLFNFANGVVPSWGIGPIINFNKYSNTTPNHTYFFTAMIADDDNIDVGIAYLYSADGSASMYDTKYKRLLLDV